MLPETLLQKQKRLWKEIETRLSGGKIEFPLMPFIAQRVMEIARDPESSANDLQRVIVSDQVIASRVLRMANSPLFPAREPISSLKQAIIRLGYKNIFNMVLASVLYTDMVGSDSYGRRSTLLWEHSVGCAMICRVIAATMDMDVEESFTVGLIHDIGKLIFYQEGVIPVGEFDSPLEFEGFVNVYHPLLGGILTESWNLPARVSEAIRYHHAMEYARDAQDLAAVTQLGNLICHHHGIGVEKGTIDFSNNEAVRFLKIPEFKMNALLDAAVDAFSVTSEIYPF